MPRRAHDGAAVVDLDVLPARRGGGHRLVGLGIRLADVLQGLVGEHHAEAERVLDPVPLVDRHLVARVVALEQDGEIEAGGPRPHDRDVHLVAGSHAGATSRRRPSAVSGVSPPSRSDVVPELAGHRLVHLVEALAVVGEDTAPHLAAQAQPELPEPVGVRQALPGGRDDVRHAGPEQLLRLLEGRDAARQDHRRPAPRGAHRLPHGAGGRPVPAERSSFVRPHGRHALVAAGPRVGIAGPAHPRLLGVLELAPAREREVVHPGPRELGAEPGRILGGVASRNAFLGQEPAAPPRTARSPRLAPRGRPRAATSPDSRGVRRSRHPAGSARRETTPWCRRGRSAAPRHRTPPARHVPPLERTIPAAPVAAPECEAARYR